MKVFILACFLGISWAFPAQRDGSLDVGENAGYYEGDIILPDGLTAEDIRNGLVDTSYRWPGAVVPYTLDSRFTADEVTAIESAFAEYAAKTCIRFIPRTDETDYVRITNDDGGCSSYVGRIGGGQRLNYASGSCITRFGTLLHEMYHALGFYHEQSRYDRDDFVTIAWENVDPDHSNNFNVYPQSVADGLGESYDYGSMMHYSRTAFSLNGEDTIIPVDPNATIGQRVGFSETDLIKVNKMYCQ